MIIYVRVWLLFMLQLTPEWPASTHPALVRLGRACLAPSPEKRPSFEAIVKVSEKHAQMRIIIYNERELTCTIVHTPLNVQWLVLACVTCNVVKAVCVWTRACVKRPGEGSPAGSDAVSAVVCSAAAIAL